MPSLETKSTLKKNDYIFINPPNPLTLLTFQFLFLVHLLSITTTFFDLDVSFPSISTILHTVFSTRLFPS